jgi:hypothetical protein
MARWGFYLRLLSCAIQLPLYDNVVSASKLLAAQENEADSYDQTNPQMVQSFDIIFDANMAQLARKAQEELDRNQWSTQSYSYTLVSKLVGILGEAFAQDFPAKKWGIWDNVDKDSKLEIEEAYVTYRFSVLDKLAIFVKEQMAVVGNPSEVLNTWDSKIKFMLDGLHYAETRSCRNLPLPCPALFLSQLERFAQVQNGIALVSLLAYHDVRDMHLTISRTLGLQQDRSYEHFHLQREGAIAVLQVARRSGRPEAGVHVWVGPASKGCLLGASEFSSQIALRDTILSMCQRWAICLQHTGRLVSSASKTSTLAPQLHAQTFVFLAVLGLLLQPKRSQHPFLRAQQRRARSLPSPCCL